MRSMVEGGRSFHCVTAEAPPPRRYAARAPSPSRGGSISDLLLPDRPDEAVIPEMEQRAGDERREEDLERVRREIGDAEQGAEREEDRECDPAARRDAQFLADPCAFLEPDDREILDGMEQ